MSKLFQSRKFLLALLTAVVDISAIVVAQFLPEWSEFVGAIMASVTVVMVAVIAGIAIEDAAALKAGTHPNQD
jgi:hypothetical protein